MILTNMMKLNFFSQGIILDISLQINNFSNYR